MSLGKRVTRTSTYLMPSKAKGGRSAGEVGTGSPGAFAMTVKPDKDTSLSRRAESGAMPKFKTITSEH